jgi:hypothetical protein
LTDIDISNNFISGSIPTELAGATSLLSVILSGNNLTGQIPPSLHKLSSLVTLKLSHNSLSGSLPLVSTLSPNLRTLDLSDNDFDTIDLSDCLLTESDFEYSCTPVALLQLNLRNNNVKANISALLNCLQGLTPTLTSLDLSSNSIIGDVLFEQISLAYLAYTGFVVRRQGLQFLVSCFLANNNITGSNVLQVFAGFGALQLLDLRNNDVHGSIPANAGIPQLLLQGNAALRAVTTTINSSSGNHSMLQYHLPAFLSPDYNSEERSDALHMFCPRLVGDNREEVQVDATYYQYQFCSCMAGYRRSESGLSCSECSPNLNCSLTMFNPVHAVLPGYYPFPLTIAEYNANSELLLSDATLVECSPAARCNPTGGTTFQCAEGALQNSFLCATCEFRSYFEWRGDCIKCNPAARWLVPVLLVIGCVLLGVSVITWLARQERAWARLQTQKATLQQNLTRELTAHPSAMMSIFLFWLQAQSLLSGVSSTQSGSSTLASVGVIGSIVNLTPVGIGCASDAFDFQHQFWILVSSPMWLVAGAAIAYCVGEHVRSLRLRHHLGLDRLQWARVCFRMLLALWSLAYMIIMERIFNTWNCSTVEFQGTPHSYLSSAAYVTCGTSQHNVMIAMGILIFILFGIGTPAAKFILSRRVIQQIRMQESRNVAQMQLHREESLVKQTAAATKAEEEATSVQPEDAIGITVDAAQPIPSLSRSLTEAINVGPLFHSDAGEGGNAPDVTFSTALYTHVATLLLDESCATLTAVSYWWQLVLVGRKLLLTALVALLPRSSVLIPLLVLIVLIVLLATHTWVRPYRSTSENRLESMLLLHLAALFFAQILEAAAESQARSRSNDGTTAAASISGSSRTGSATRTLVLPTGGTLTVLVTLLEVAGFIILVVSLAVELLEYRRRRIAEKLHAQMAHTAMQQIERDTVMRQQKDTLEHARTGGPVLGIAGTPSPGAAAAPTCDPGIELQVFDRVSANN